MEANQYGRPNNPVPPEDEQISYEHLIPEEKRRKYNRHHKRPKTALWVILAVLVTFGISVGTYFLFLKNSGTSKKTTTSQTGSPTTTKTVKPDPTTQNYKSAKLNLQFTTRRDWAVKEDIAASQVTVTSPPTTYTDGNGNSANGTFVLKFTSQTPEDATQTIQNGKAILPSEVIAYSAPTDAQRVYTAISYAGDNDKVSYFVVTGATSFKAGDSLGAVFIGDGSLMIVGGFSGANTGKFINFQPVAKDQFTSTSGYLQALDIVKSLKVF